LFGLLRGNSMRARRDFRLFVLMSVILAAVCGIVTLMPTPTFAQTNNVEMTDLSGTLIYFSEAFGEPSQFDRTNAGISRFAALLRFAGAEVATLEWRKGIPNDADLLIIPAPSTDLPADMVARLWAYIRNGGRILLAVDAFDNRSEVSRALPEGTGLFQLLWQEYGLRAGASVLVTEGEVRPVEIEERRDGNVVFTFTGELPVLDLGLFSRRVDPAQAITTGLSADLLPAEDEPANLNSLFLTGVRPLQINSELGTVVVTPLVLSEGDNVYGETDYARYRASGYVEYNIGTDTSRGDLVLAASFEDTATEGRLVLLGDVDLFRNGTGFAVSPSYSASFVYPFNVQFMLNTVSWLLDRQAQPLELATPAPTATATLTPSPTPVATATPTPGA
jgi:hypothetical protein